MENFEIKEKLAALEEALNEKLPSIPTLLQDIHRQLKKDSDLVTILSEEECATIIRGLKKQTATEIVTTSLKKSKKKITIADL